jgi:glucose/arabinose dehydrogenase
VRHALASIVIALFLSACAGAPAPSIQAPSDTGLPWPLTLPAGYRISLYASGLEEVRDVAFSPAGVPYVTVMNRAVRRGGKVLALPDDNHDGRADRTVVVADELDRPHGIAFYKGQLYVSEPATIWLLRDTNGDLVADAREPIVDNLPSADDHWARPFVFDQDGAIMVAVGSRCNACQEGDKRRATVLRFASGGAKSPDTRGDIFARGLRSVVGLAWRPGTQELWATNNGRDGVSPDQPPDQVFHLGMGAHYGWPYCYGDRVPDPQILQDTSIVTPDHSSKETFCREQAAAPALLLPPHSAPLGMAFYDGARFPADVRGSLFVALHGAFDLANNNGYRVVRIPFVDGKPGRPEDFITGWMPAGAKRWLGRPVGVAVGPQGDLFITDDVNGFLYRVDYIGK